MSRSPFFTDRPLLALALMRSVFGIAMVYSAGQTDVPTFVTPLYKQQMLWLVVGLVGAYAISRVSVRAYELSAVPVYLVACALLVLLLFVGVGAGTAASTKSWLSVGGIRVGQPSELSKIAVVLMLARILSARREAPKSLIGLWQAGLAVFVPWALIMRQPDLGTGLVLVGVFFAMLFWAGVAWQLLVLVASPVVSLVLAFNTGLWGAWFIVLLALVVWYRPKVLESVTVVMLNVLAGVAAPMLWGKLSPYQQNRLLVFLDPSADPLASGYHVIQSQVAIGSGGWLGKGFTLGTQKRLAFLPAQHTDFIFSVVGEELGFLGVTVALVLGLLFVQRMVRIAARSADPFASLVAFGLATGGFIHFMVNVGMTINLMPVTGIPLPFFSYGGSFLVTTWLGVGILLRISSEGRGRPDMLVI